MEEQISAFLKGDQLKTLEAAAKKGMKEHPWATLGVAFGIGLLIGVNPSTRKLAWSGAMMGGRMLAGNVAQMMG